MKILQIAWKDISSVFKNRFIRIAIVAIIVLPVLYSFLFLDAFWDPYGKLDRIHVAVVNMDNGGVKDGKNVNYGDEIVDKLKDNTMLGWVFTNAQDAENGLIKGKYYGKFVIPENFTNTALKLKDVEPEQLKIYFADNEKVNFIMSQLNRNVKLEVKQEITKSLMEKGSGELFDKIALANPGIKKIVEGSNNLKEGVASLNKSGSDMKSSVDKLKNSAAQIADGLNTVSLALDNKSLVPKNKVTKVNKDNELFTLIQTQNVNKLRSVMEDAQKLKDADTSMLSVVPKVLTPENIEIIKRMGHDIKDADIMSMLKDPLIKNLSVELNAETILSVKALVNDADQLSNVNMSKLTPMLTLLDKSTQLNGLMSQAQTLSSMDMSVLKPFNTLLGQSQQLSGLMLQAGALSLMDLSKLDSTKQLLTTENATELSSLLKNASSLNSVDTKAMGAFLIQQVASIDKFNTDTEVLRNQSTLKSLEQLVDVQYPANGTAVQQKSNVQLKAVLNGYYNAIAQTNTNMQSSKTALTSMGTTLSGLGTLQAQLAKDAKLIAGAGAALTPENVTTINGMLAQLQAAQAAMRTPEAITAFRTIQTAMSPGNIKTITTMMEKLQAAQASMKTPEAVAAIQTVQAALTPENITYIKGVMEQLTAMKVDLDKNKSNLLMAQTILKKFDDPKTVASLNKIKTLTADLNKATPLINMLSSQMTDANMAKLSDAPKLVNQLTSMQKELKDNNEVILLAQRAMNDDNVELANNLINAIPDITNQVNMIAEGTASLYKNVNKLTANKEAIKKFVSEPLVLSEKKNFPVDNYGTGFAPYFIPLSLWVGALMMFFVVSDKTDSKIKANPAQLVIGKFLSNCYIGIAQAVIVSIAVLGLGLRPDSILLYFAFNIFMSITFISIIQCLVFLFGLVGKMVSLILLILQLTSCAGTFPLELVPKFFRVINPCLPFTYCVSALREIIGGIDYSVLSKDFAVLFGFGFAFLIILVLFKGHADKLQEVINEKKDELVA
jgi:putative membrane protein